MKKIIKNILFLTLLVGFVSCSDNNDDVTGETIVTPGVYIADLSLQTERGENNEILSRGVDQSAGVFTDEYPLDYIYIHSADASDKDHKSLKIPLKKEEAEDGDVKQKAVHLELEVLENGDYIVGYGDEANVIKFFKNEKVYFSTLETPYWEAKVEGATPVTGSDVFVEDAKNNIELLRSADPYDRAGLEALLKKPSIELTRCTTGFKVYFMFTDVNEKITETGDRQYVISKDSWKQEVGYAPENFYVKLYFGPNFAHKYDIQKDEPVQIPGKRNGYYVTNHQIYKPFDVSKYIVGGDDAVTYMGYGYQSDHILLSPLDENIPATEFSIYAFIKFSGEAVDNDFLVKDNGSKYFRTQIEGMTTELNRIHYVVLVYSYKDLKKAFLEDNSQSIKTRSPWSGPEKMELTPAKVIVR